MPGTLAVMWVLHAYDGEGVIPEPWGELIEEAF
jgi:hypothetical protein